MVNLHRNRMYQHKMGEAVAFVVTTLSHFIFVLNYNGGLLQGTTDYV